VRETLKDRAHLLRVAAVFAAGLVVFFIARGILVPEGFGQYGHYRAPALKDVRGTAPSFAGRQACADCHTDVPDVLKKGKHAGVGCEACHGPLGAHARGETDVAPVRPSPRAVCLTCHTAKEGLPSTFPRIVVKEHSEAGPCTDCHEAHAPGIS